MTSEIERQLDENIQAREHIVSLWNETKSNLEATLSEYETLAIEIEQQGGNGDKIRAIIQDMRNRADNFDTMLRESTAELRGMTKAAKAFLPKN